MTDLLRFDELCFALFIPRDTDDATADAARAALDDPNFLDTLQTTIRQLFTTIPALTVLTVAVDV